MRIRESCAFWSIEDALNAYELCRDLIESYYDDVGIERPKDTSENVENWIRFSEAIERLNNSKKLKIRRRKYPLSKILFDSIEAVAQRATSEEGLSKYQNAVTGRDCIRALLFPFILSGSPFWAKEITNKLIENRRLFEKTRNVDLTSLLGILIRFRDEISKRGIYSKVETLSIMNNMSLLPLDDIRSDLSPNTLLVLDHLLHRGITTIEAISKETQMDIKDTENYVDDIIQTESLPIQLYDQDAKIITPECRFLHVWQLNEEIKVRLHPDFAEQNQIPNEIILLDLKNTASEYDLQFHRNVEANVEEICIKPMMNSFLLDRWYFPLKDPFIIGSLLWYFDEIPDFVLLMTLDDKMELISGAIDHILRENRDEFLMDSGLRFQYLSKKTSIDLFKILRTDLNIQCKRPNNLCCEVFDEGIMELVRNLKTTEENKTVLLRCLNAGTETRIKEITNESMYKRIICKLLLESGSRTANQIAIELCLDKSIVDNLIEQMKKDLQIIQSGETYFFSIDVGDILSIINDDQIRKLLKFD